MSLIITLGFMLLDIISGFVASVMSNTWESSKMRIGLFHKVGIIITIVCSYMCEYAQQYMELGFTLPIVQTVLIYICIMEIGSVGENVLKINPQLGDLVSKIGGRKNAN